MSSADRLEHDNVTQPLLGGNGELSASQRADNRSRGPSSTEEGTFKRNLGTLEAFAVIVAIVIGSGVFTSPGAIDTNTPSPAAALLVWLVGGILAWTGAMTLAELGTAIPGEGGVQAYLKYVYGDTLSFLAAWTWIIALMPATVGILSIVIVESIYSAAGITEQADKIEHKILALVVSLIGNFANCISTTASTRFNSFFVAVKFTGIAAVVLAGIVTIIIHFASPEFDVGGSEWYQRSWFTYRTTMNSDGTETHWSELTTWEMFGHYSAALYAALWAYSGWDKAIYISAELSDPGRQLPLALNTAIPTVMVCFIASNAFYYILLPWNLIATTDSAAVTAFSRILGPLAGVIAAIFVCLASAGTLLGTSFVAGRMAVSAANKNWFPRFFAFVGRAGFAQHPEEPVDAEDASKSSKSDAPVNAILFSTGLSLLYIIFGNFRALLTFTGLGEYVFFFLAVFGCVLLRFREPNLERPYKPSILAPVIFLLVSGFVVLRGASFSPLMAFILLMLWIVGLAVYWVRRRWSEDSAQPLP